MFHEIYQISGKYPLSTGNVMQCYKERHPSMLDYFITFLIYIGMIIVVSDSIFDCLYGPDCVISAENNSQILCQIAVDAISTLEMGCVAAGCNINCCLSISSTAFLG